jgi:preprotein translocase SecE subunit
MKKIGKFLREAYNELKKVVWPTKANVINLTITVVVVSVLVGLFLAGADFVFSRLMRLVIGN